MTLDRRKPETIIRELKRHAKQLAEGMSKVQRESETLRARALRAEAGCAEWKGRFDLLLAHTPEAFPPRAEARWLAEDR